MNTESNFLVSIIIPTYKDWVALNVCLGCLEQQSFPIDKFEIIIVNNDSTHDVPVEIKSSYRIRIIHEPKPGSYAARNAGLRAARGEIIGFTDSDCLPEEDWISNAYKYFSRKNAERIGGKIEISFRDSKHKTVAELYESCFSFDQKRNVEKFNTSITANFFTRKIYFDTVGLFDSSKKSGDDFGWNRRANDLNIKLDYACDVIVNHPARRTLSELAKKRKRVYGGYKNFNDSSLKGILKEFLHFPSVFLKFFINPIGQLFNEKNHSIKENVQISYVILYLYLITQVEYFKLLFGSKPSR